MILFVLEGGKPDLGLYRTMMRVCGVVNDTVALVYGCNIDALYQDMIELGEGADIVELLKSKYPNNLSSDNGQWLERTDKISEVYLVFDYDFHDVLRSPEEMNEQIYHLLRYFNEETDHGKLYINYPMVESIWYTKELPDPEYRAYSVSREECRQFKHLASVFSFYPNSDFIIRGTDEELQAIWELLKKQNVSKANYICNNTYSYPPENNKSISQLNILQNQVLKYESLPDCRVAVLSSFPLIMYEWLGR